MALIITEIILFVRRRLYPIIYLVFQIIKTTLWLVLFCISIVGLVQNTRIGLPYQSALYLFTGIIQVTVVLLSFTGTLVYASVIYHRHRRNVPYHRSTYKAKANNDNDGDKGPFVDPKSGFLNRSDRPSSPSNRDSTTAPEMDIDASTRKAKDFKELDNDTEIREKYSPEGFGDEKRWKRVGGTNELQGDERVYELSTEKSIRGSKRTMTLESDGEMAVSKP
ncbi:MAG: hypothetical protein Q9182_003804 [Xanthomendoza sp. 2 TL-2023]